MKACAYCGRDNDDSVTRCRECGQENFQSKSVHPVAQSEESVSSEAFQPRLLSDEERQQAFVTLKTCRTVDEASLLQAQLKAAGIEAFLPDEALMSTLAWNTNGF